jgi:hypothetical protein
VIVANKRAVASSRKKSCVDERAEHGVAGHRIESPEPLRLLGRQSQTRHLEELASNTSNNILDSP